MIAEERPDKVELSLPANVEASIYSVDSPSELLKTFDPALVWRHAEDGTDLHLALSLEVAGLARISPKGLPLQIGKLFTIGTDFFSSLVASDGDKDRQYANAVRKKCAQLIHGEVDLDIASFDVIRVLDKALSFRMHVTKHKEALRLMFWRCSAGHIELANVGPKPELSISTGSPLGAFSSRFQISEET